MKSIVVLTVVLALLLTASVSCSPYKINASPGEQFTLPVGETAGIKGESLAFKLIEVTADSRCPTGVVCIQAGEAKCHMLITYKGVETEAIFTQLGGSVTNVTFKQYKISFTVEPYPEAGKEIAASDYKIVMTVTK
jgi:hypothetical protein